MAPFDERWNELLPEDWIAFARAWLKELRTPPPHDADRENASQAVVRMNFTAAPEQQWQFIVAAVQLATTQTELDHIAAGPIEHLLGWHGKDFIERLERQVAADEKFRRALNNVWRYLMTSEVWARVQALRAEPPTATR